MKISNRFRYGLTALLGLAIVGYFIAANWTWIRAEYSVRQLRNATDQNERRTHIQSLLALNDPGFEKILSFLRTNDRTICALIAKELPTTASDRNRIVALLTILPECDQAGCEAILSAMPELINNPDPELIELTIKALACGFQSSTRAKVLAVRLAAHPALNQTELLVPMLLDPVPEVRIAALTTIGTAGDSSIISDEELFRWMSDPDPTVRSVCLAVLESRGRSLEEIDLGRRLKHPKPEERLQLLMDLSRETQRDIGPWLERLGHDPEPAVRAGAARVACERKLLYSDWVDELARNDPSATVRLVATYHRRKASGLIEPVRFEK